MVCFSPRLTKPVAMRWASRVVMRPWSTASPSTSSMRSRESMTISSGLMRFFFSASRNSATVFASIPALPAPLAAFFAVVPAAFFDARLRALA